MAFSAPQIADMAQHIHGCDLCGDEEIRAELNESLPVEEIADTIATAHDPRWLAIMAKGQERREGL